MLSHRAGLWTLGGIGTLSVLLTVLLFFFCVPKPSPLQNIALYTLLASECLTLLVLGLLLHMRKRSGAAFAIAGMSTAAFLYCLASLIVALVHIATLQLSIRSLLVLQGLCLTLFLMTLTLLCASARALSAEQDTLQSRHLFLQRLTARLQDVCLKLPAWERELARYADDIRFFDASCSVPADALLDQAVTRLEQVLKAAPQAHEEKEMDLQQLVKALAPLMAQRRAEAEACKKGRF